MERSQEVWFIHSRVVAAFEAEEGRPAGEAGSSDEALGLAHAHLLEKAGAIRDEDLRAGFLQNLPLHRAIAEMIAARREAVRGEAARRERSLYEISKSINSILDLEPLLDRLLDLAVETTRAEKGMVVVRDLSGGLTVKAARDMAQESIADATEICQSVISDVSRRGEAIIAADASADERFRERKSIINFRIRSLMCVPLVVRGELIGAVYVDSRGETAFGREDLLFLSSFAHLAAIAIDNARLLARLREENLYLRREVETRFRFENLIGASAAMRAVFDTMEKVARTPASVLIIGETGTGKEQIARALHYHGPRKERPFVAVDCGALPENLLESELFGHRRGAFSGALYDRVGLFEEAEGGTIFLDEITNTTSDLQAKLLRVLQEGEIRRVGENQYRKVDVRVIAATNLPIEQAVEEGRFRQDLFYRLNVVPIRVPPLSERREDIPLLASHFLKRCAERLGRKVEGFTEEAMAVLVRSPWRGNVRELEHAIEKALILSERDRIGVDALADLPGAAAALAKAPSVPPGRPAAALEEPGEFAGMSLEDFDRRWLTAESAYLRHLVEEANGNFSQAARLARVRNRNTLIARLRRHGIGR
jgi:Nif-specific regulatory protein